MKLRDFFSSIISPSDFIHQTNIINCCDYIFQSDFFCEENKEHFGITSIENCINQAPKKSCIIMCRFVDGEIEKLIESCRSRSQYKFVIVQTLVGDDGFMGKDLISLIPNNILSIYSKNIRITHPKLKPIPIGRDWRNTSESNAEIYCRSNFHDYENTAYLNFSIETCPKVRGKVYDLFSSKSWVTTRVPLKKYVSTHVPISYKTFAIPHKQYLEEIHNHKFCFSPVGKALDCYRTWDSLYAKTIPIVDTNSQVDNFKTLPILFTKNWKEINYSYLEDKYLEMLDADYDFSLALTSYWIDLFNSIRKTNF